MSGSNSMCVARVLLETGLLPIEEPGTHLTLEAPGGLIQVKASCRNNRVEQGGALVGRNTVAKKDKFTLKLS